MQVVTPLSRVIASLAIIRDNFGAPVCVRERTQVEMPIVINALPAEAGIGTLSQKR